MFSKHVTKDISAYCHGELSPEESRQFAEHVMSCAKCRREFEEIKRGVKLAEQLPQIDAPESLWAGVEARLGEQQPSITTSSRAWQLRVAAVAAVVVVVGVLGVWWFREQGSKTELTRGFWQVHSLEGTPRFQPPSSAARQRSSMSRFSCNTPSRVTPTGGRTKLAMAS